MSTEHGASEDKIAQIAAWARAAGGMAEACGVRVTERACSRSGWPPLEVVIAFESADGWHDRIVHKSLERLTRLDVVGAWRGGDACCEP